MVLASHFLYDSQVSSTLPLSLGLSLVPTQSLSSPSSKALYRVDSSCANSQVLESNLVSRHILRNHRAILKIKISNEVHWSFLRISKAE